jgi:hypothetical protein
MTLVMALACVLGWGRSFACFDWVNVPYGSYQTYVVYSQGQFVCLQHNRSHLPMAHLFPIAWGSGRAETEFVGIKWQALV